MILTKYNQSSHLTKYDQSSHRNQVCMMRDHGRGVTRRRRLKGGGGGLRVVCVECYASRPGAFNFNNLDAEEEAKTLLTPPKPSRHHV